MTQPAFGAKPSLKHIFSNEQNSHRKLITMDFSSFEHSQMCECEILMVTRFNKKFHKSNCESNYSVSATKITRTALSGRRNPQI